MRVKQGSIILALASLVAVACSADTEESSTTLQSLTVQSSACRVDYTVSGEWGSGFGADVVITNKGAAKTSWTLEWTYPSGQKITSLWNGAYTQSGGNVSVRNAGWNGALASGATVSFGFNGSLSGANGSPTGFRLNGVSCDGGGTGSGGGAATGGAPSTGGTASTGGSIATGGTTSSGGSSSCTFPDWRQGTSYRTGDVVRYQGSLYVAEHDNPGYDPLISTWYWDPYTGGCTGNGGAGGGGAGGGTSTGGTTSGTGFATVVSRAQFDAIFPNRNSFYTYDGLVEAAAVFPDFAAVGSLETRKQEAAAFLANVAHETGNLVYIEELAQGEYCQGGVPSCACAPGQRYFGRGPIQLSWNYNYCAASLAIFNNRDVLRLDPGRVAREAKIAWATALWFWMTQTGAGSMTCHNAMVTGAGFGQTIRTINGALECNGGNPTQVQSRISSYQSITAKLGCGTGSNLGC